MFDTPYYRGNDEFKMHHQFQKHLHSRRDEFCVPDNAFNGTGYSTIRSDNRIHLEYPEFGAYLNEAISKYDDKLQCTHAWVNINPQGSYQTRHNHACCDMAGTYYVTVPDADSGNIQFYNPSPTVEAMMIHQPYHCSTHLHIPTEKDILIWPGFLDHEVTYNYSDEERWSVSFMLSLTHLDRLERFPSMLVYD